MNRIAVDTGPLVALLNARDEYHSWARDLFEELRAPMLTCEAVLAEACFLVSGAKGGPDAVMALVTRGIVEPVFRLREETREVRALMAKYASVPMSLADACLVRMAETNAEASVLTLDSDFGIYRKNGRLRIPVISPP